MRFSQLYAPTVREAPAEAEVVSHQLLLKAGFVRKTAGGIYTYLPLAWRVLRKIEQIVREEMDAKGGQEIAMPIVQPAEIWQESGRWEVYGDEMFRLRDRHSRSFCLGPTHEEIVTTLVKGDVRSYRQLPLLLYQIQNKYRDEIRPRFGLLRGREFIMKDLYSFDRDQAGLEASYRKMYDAYSRIFARCGLKFRPVEADSGAIGGSGSHEFMALANSGEAEIVYCESCDFAANIEKAELNPIAAREEETCAPEKVSTPNAATIKAVCAYLAVPVEKSVKAVGYKSDKGVVLAFVRGDHEVNAVKVLNTAGALTLSMAGEDELRAAGTEPGYMGLLPGKKNVTLVVDHSVMNMRNFVCGADVLGYHYVNVNPGRDFTPDFTADIRMIQETDPCPRCGGRLTKAKGIEVGQVFKLHTKYSEKLAANYLDENGKERPLVMGCYGIGVSRVMAAVIEQSSDDAGIIWPAAIAPYHVAVVPVNAKNAEQMKIAEEIYETLTAVGIETVLDDRAERAGVKFNDADLIGYPLRVTVGAKTAANRELEIKIRASGEVVFAPDGSWQEKIRELLAAL
ncbi:MAG: proline--tRNA ligase [Acidaminococcales bacterium]|jgi:prolyl-tRNA synthetase|nr:proline--tRNA ligase [Acidaminococcales bacterium]